MKTIIVPVDFSTVSDNAAEFAANLAIFYGAEILLYHAYEIPITLTDYAFPVFDIEEMQRAAEHDLDELKIDLQKKLRFPVTINCKTEMNIFQNGLTAICDDIKPDLVVMGLSGKTGLTKLIVGSNTIKAINDLKYPLLIVPSAAAFIPITKIGLACDYNLSIAEVSLLLLKKLIKDFNAELHVMNVDFQNKNFKPETLQGSFKVYDLLNDLNPVYHNIEAKEITEGINDFANQVGLNWLVAMPKKHNLLHKIFHRSHTQDLVYHARVPVLCLHD